MPDCQHVRLYKCIVGATKFYRCDACGENFAIPKPLAIEVTHPERTREAEK